MDRDKALAKVKKCLALSRSNQPHEAAAALRQAQKLMQEHGLSDADIELSSIGEAPSQPVCGGLIPAWKASLGRVICDAFGAEMFWNTSRKLGPSFKVLTQSRVIFVAPAPWAEVASYTFDVLHRQCDRARKAHIQAQSKSCKTATKTARGDAFALGWVLGVRPLVERLTGAERQQALIEQYMQARHAGMKTFDPVRRDVGRNVKDTSYQDGHRAGAQAQLDHAVTGTSAPKQIGLAPPRLTR
ncbi:MAG: hypothetical protein RLY71_451 [Pseudomonadota bacterium]